MRNKELIDKRFMQIEGKLQTLKYQLRGKSSKEEFGETITKLEETVEDLKSLIERSIDPLRNG